MDPYWGLGFVTDYAKAFACVDHNKLWKILQEMGIPDHLTYLLRNLYAVKETTVRTGSGTTDWFQIGKGICQGCILSNCLFNLHAEYILRNAGLDEASWNQDCQEKYQSPQICRWHHSYGRKLKRTKEPLDESERREWNVGLNSTFRKLRSWHLVPSLHANRCGNSDRLYFYFF